MAQGTLSLVLGLPDNIHACLFDLDGVLTDTAAVHRAAWKCVFDIVLAAHGMPEFTDDDYAEYVDGKPRLNGTRDFLASRDLHVDEGSDNDPPDAETIRAIAARKNNEVRKRIKEDGVAVFPGSKRYLEAAVEADLRRVVVSSSANTEDVLHVTGLETFIEHRVDGVTIVQQDLAGKPAPDSFLMGARLAGVDARRAAVFEDATSGVEAGRRVEFGFVVGVNRLEDAQSDALGAQGADIAVTEFGGVR